MDQAWQGRCHLCSCSACLNLVTWLDLTEREAGNCSLAKSPRRRQKGFDNKLAASATLCYLNHILANMC